MTDTATPRTDLGRVVVHSKQFHAGTWPDEDNIPCLPGTEIPRPAVEVEVTVRVLPYAENELIAHYLINQVTRDALARVDRMGLNRVQVAP